MGVGIEFFERIYEMLLLLYYNNHRNEKHHREYMWHWNWNRKKQRIKWEIILFTKRREWCKKNRVYTVHSIVQEVVKLLVELIYIIKLKVFLSVYIQTSFCDSTISGNYILFSSCTINTLFTHQAENTTSFKEIA